MKPNTEKFLIEKGLSAQGGLLGIKLPWDFLGDLLEEYSLSQQPEEERIMSSKLDKKLDKLSKQEAVIFALNDITNQAIEYAKGLTDPLLAQRAFEDGGAFVIEHFNLSQQKTFGSRLGVEMAV